MNVPVADPRRAFERREGELRSAIDRVLASGRYIGGAEVEAFEREFAAYFGTSHAVGVASGTDALELALRAAGVGPGDAVATVSMTAVATVAAIELAGARPLLVEIDPERCTLDPMSLERLLAARRVRAIVPVHLYGQPADMPRVLELAAHHGAVVIEDCAQAHGAAIDGRKCGTWGAISAFSFYPTKNLGALGDGGAVVTRDPALAERVRLLREYGWRERYVSEVAGRNSRLDSLHAAVLRVKLPHLDRDNGRRREIARRYCTAFADTGLGLPVEVDGATPVYHQFVVRALGRDAFRERLARFGIDTAIHYPLPVHLQPAYRGRLELEGDALPHSELASREVVSLPCFPELSDAEVGRVIDAVRKALLEH